MSEKIKSMKKLLVLTTIFLTSCSMYSSKNDHRILSKNSIPALEMINGVSRLAYLINDNLTLDDFISLFGNDFDKKSKKLNTQTNCYEYIVHIYPSLNLPILAGFNKENEYVYSIDINNKNLEKRKKITWVKDQRKDLKENLENLIDQRNN